MGSRVGERIKYFRLRLGLSQEKLALSADLNPAFLGHLERGLKSPTITTLDKIVKALNLSYCEFFDDNKNLNDTESNLFYIDIIKDYVQKLPEDKVKTMAEIVQRMISLTGNDVTNKDSTV